MNTAELKSNANEIRKWILKSIHAAKAGHPGGSLSSADIITYLYFEEMKNIDPKNPCDPDRDRFVLSKGHAAPALYATLAQKGFIPKEDLMTLRKMDSYLQGHPDMHTTSGVDMSTGSLGQGVSAAVGMALAGKLDGKDYRVFALLGDGELQEGEVWEAAMFAGSKNIDNLIVIVDNNDLQIDGCIKDVNSPYPITDKFAAFNFNVVCCADGHDFESLKEAFEKTKNKNGKPYAIICNTVKGKGVSYMENVAGWHGKAPDDKELETALYDLSLVE